MISLYVQVTYAPARPRVLLFRSPWWDSLPGLVFAGVVRYITSTTPMPFEVLLPSRTYYSFEDLSTMHAVALFPDNLNKGQFYDFYMMHMPLFVPTKELFVRAVCALNDYNDNKDEFRGFLPRSGERIGADHAGFDPFFNCSREGDFRKPALLYELTDYALYPHVAHFASAPELLSLLIEKDFA